VVFARTRADGFTVQSVSRTGDDAPRSLLETGGSAPVLAGHPNRLVAAVSYRDSAAELKVSMAGAAGGPVAGWAGRWPWLADGLAYLGPDEAGNTQVWHATASLEQAHPVTRLARPWRPDAVVEAGGVFASADGRWAVAVVPAGETVTVVLVDSERFQP
jgi:hypothetical protein